MEKKFENKSLRFICNSINLGLIEYDKPEQLKIISKNKPDTFIKIIDIDLSKYLLSIIKDNPTLRAKVSNFESNVYDYVVFTLVDSDITKDKKDMLAISLFELISVSNKLEKDNVETKNLVNNLDELYWSLDSEEWDLIIEDC